MKKQFAAIFLIAVFLAVLIPLASSNPDGLEKVTETFGAQEQEPFWNGLFSNYNVSSITNSYASMLISGIFGAVMVLLATLILGKTLKKKERK